MLWIMVSVVTSTHPLISIKYVLAKYWYLLAFVGAPLVLFRDTRHLKRSLAVLLFSMMAVMLLTLVRHAQNGWTFEKINDSLTPFYRNHVNYSSLLVVMVPLLIAFIRLSENSWKKRLLIVLLIITLAALYFSYARGAWLALITGWLAYVLLKKRLLPVSFFLFFALAAAAFWWLKEEDHYVQYASDYRTTIFHKNFSEHMIATYKLKDMSTVERFYRWVAGVRMIKDSWKTGFGPNTFYENYKSYTTPAFKTWVSKNEEHSTVHNYFLLLIIEQGVMGLLLFLMLIGAMFWYAQTIYHRTDHPFWKTVALTTASVLMMVCTINFLSDMIETDKVGSIFYLCLGGIVIADLRTRREMIDN
jgi:O-antigen ligase